MDVERSEQVRTVEEHLCVAVAVEVVHHRLPVGSPGRNNFFRREFLGGDDFAGGTVGQPVTDGKQIDHLISPKSQQIGSGDHRAVYRHLNCPATSAYRCVHKIRPVAPSTRCPSPECIRPLAVVTNRSIWSAPRKWPGHQ